MTLGEFIYKVKHYWKHRIRVKIHSDRFKRKYPEFAKEIEFVERTHSLAPFPYDFIENYKENKYPFTMDETSGLPYCEYEGDKVYYPAGRKLDEIAHSFMQLRMEQDLQSPHRYFTDFFKPEEDDLFVDVGCAEGLEALEALHKGQGKHFYLIEASESWQKPLQLTFEPYKDKVTVIRKMVSSEAASDETVRLDDIIPYGEKILLKLDVEGMELSCLKSAENLIKNSKKVKIAVCTYHNQDDADILEDYLTKLGFSCEYSQGYMLFMNEKSNQKEPYFRHGVLRAVKK